MIWVGLLVLLVVAPCSVGSYYVGKGVGERDEARRLEKIWRELDVRIRHLERRT